MKIRFAPQAEVDLRDTLRFIRKRNPPAAKKLANRVLGGLLYRVKRPRRGSSWLRLTQAELLAKLLAKTLADAGGLPLVPGRR